MWVTKNIFDRLDCHITFHICSRSIGILNCTITTSFFIYAACIFNSNVKVSKLSPTKPTRFTI